jgi:hypothetical protein
MAELREPLPFQPSERWRVVVYDRPGGPPFPPRSKTSKLEDRSEKQPPTPRFTFSKGDSARGGRSCPATSYFNFVGSTSSKVRPRARLSM